MLARKAFMYYRATGEIIGFVQSEVKPDMADSKAVFEKANGIYSGSTKAIVKEIKGPSPNQGAHLTPASGLHSAMPALTSLL